LDNPLVILYVPSASAVFTEANPRMTTHRHFTDVELAAWRRDGFIVVRGLLGAAEIAEVTRWADALQAWPETPGKHMKYFDGSLAEPGARLLNRIENFCPYHEGFDRLINGDALRGRTAELLGGPAVLFKEKVNFKLPGGGGFEAHQDIQAGWASYAEMFVTALVGIDAATVENGCLEVAAGHHTRGMFGDMWQPLADDQLVGVDFAPVLTEPGDAVFFDCFTPHRSAPNLSDAPRRVLYVTYNRAAAGDHRAQYYADKRANYPPDCERDTDKEYAYRV